jgi:hypothetical protein
MHQRGLIGAGFCVAVVVGVALIQTPANAGRPTSTAVRTTIADALNSYPLRIASDSKGTYAPGKVLSSTIDTLGDWSLTTYATAATKITASDRTVFFDLTEPASPDNPIPPITAAYLQAHLIAKCHLVDVHFLNIPAGMTVQCPGTFRFLAPNGNWYRFSFQPENFPEVDRLSVTCEAADSGGCKLWTIASSGTTRTGTDPNPKSLNRLVQIDSGGNTILADLGNYYLSFSLTVAR